MSIWAIIPVKPFAMAKSRLSSVLSPEQRQILSMRMLTHMLDELAKVPELDRRLVVSRDPKVLSLARRHKAFTVQETEPYTGLNNALVRARLVAQTFGVHAILVLPMDLPMMRAEHISSLLAQMHPSEPSLLLVPDRHELGTNALLSNPPDLVSFSYGPNSLQIHQQSALKKGAFVKIVYEQALQLDIDYPSDLELLYGGSLVRPLV
jgi:2-phospho-L-lactate guanylyltransferase